MCGIIISNLLISDFSFKFLKNRGPDFLNKVSFNDINFYHFLLQITGDFTPQPLIKNNIVVIFNGEIYNYKEILSNAKSDGYSILECYQKYGDDFIKYLDGEFTIILFDFNKDKLFIASDLFKTKPLFYNINNDIVISSYESVCKNIKNQHYNKINANEVLIFNLTTRKLIKKYNIYNFDLKQYKDNYDDFCNSLEKAILKRYPDKEVPLVFLSSGLDSGTIACCLHKYNKKAYFISISKNENEVTLNERKKILGDTHVFLTINDKEKKYWKNYLDENCEPTYWDWKYNPNVKSIANCFTQGSMLSKSKIFDYVKKNINNNIKVSYSGIGADEVMANNSFYSCGYGNVNKFEENLQEIFPWKNFFEGAMENYLKSDETIGGCFSFETRYPFCDKDVVQEFIWLKPELKNEYKNSIYKPALLYYLEQENFPMAKHKLGFNV